MPTLQTTPPPSLTHPPPEPRWEIDKIYPTLTGALLIRDSHGAYVGVATAGDGVKRRATMMALAPQMLDACRLLVQAKPLTVARLQRLGALPHQELLEAAALAEAAVAAMEALPLGDRS